MTAPHKPIDLSTVIKTPENIEFAYRLAGPFRRLPAYICDILFLWLFIGLIYIFFLTLAAWIGFNSQILGEFGYFAAIVSGFFLWWFYGAFFEAIRNGQTPGKSLFRLRVISVDGRPVNAMQAVIRNLLRVADSAPLLSLEMLDSSLPAAYVIPTFLCGFLCMVLTQRFQRLGDIAAGTIVVINERGWIPPQVVLSDTRVPSLASYIPAHFKLTNSLAKTIAMFMEKRVHMHPLRRAELASYIGNPLRKRFGFREDTCPDLLLCAIYYREFVAENRSTGELNTHDPNEDIKSHGNPFPVSTTTEQLASAQPAPAQPAPAQELL